MKNYIIIGMPGSGKTTVSIKVASLSGYKFIDLDDEITKSHGEITGIFENEGETTFRKYETEELTRAMAEKMAVISTGGGIIEKEENREILKSGTVIFIDRPIEDIFSTLDAQSRPLLKDKEEVLHVLYKRRYPIYVNVADYHIRNVDSVKDCVDSIVKIIKV